MKQRKRISLDWLDRGRTALEPLLALAYPRHCPLCGTVLEQSAWKAAVCRSCIPEAERLRHLPPRLPVTEHAFYAVNTCAAAFYYAPCYPALQGERQPLVCARTGGFDGCADFWRTARPCPRVPPGIRESIRHFAVQRHCSGAAARKEEPRGKYAPFASAAPWAHPAHSGHPAAVPDPAGFTAKIAGPAKALCQCQGCLRLPYWG